MARVIAAILRHGDYHQRPQTPSAHQPFPLTDQGATQSRQASAMLRETIVEQGWALCPSIHSSRQLRAWQTADIIRHELSDLVTETARITSIDALAERCVGSAANLTIGEIETIVAEDPRYSPLPEKWKSDSHFCLPFQGAESLMDSGERTAQHMSETMQTLAAESTIDTVKLFVGHGAAFRHAAYHLGVLAFEQIAKLSMYHAEPVFLEYHVHDAWRHIGGNWKVRAKYSEYTD